MADLQNDPRNMMVDTTDLRAATLTDALRTGDVASLVVLLKTHPELATSYVGGSTEACTLLHILADWPGTNRDTAKILIAAGADMNANFTGQLQHGTPLHWAASSNDVALLDTLPDHGADMNAGGGVIDKAALADARAFLQLDAAHKLIARGAKATLQDLATLGLSDQDKHSRCSMRQNVRPGTLAMGVSCLLQNSCT